jgi:hypothetical protein
LTGVPLKYLSDVKKLSAEELFDRDIDPRALEAGGPASLWPAEDGQRVRNPSASICTGFTVDSKSCRAYTPAP